MHIQAGVPHRSRTSHQGSYAMRANTDDKRVRSFLIPDTLIDADPITGDERVLLLPLEKEERVCGWIMHGDRWLILTTSGGWLFDPKEGSRAELPEPLRIALESHAGYKVIERAPDGSLWIGMNDQGVLVTDSALAITAFYPLLPASDRPLRITAIAFDRQGNSWVGSDGKGAFKIAPQRIKFGRCMPGIGFGTERPSAFVRRFAQWDDRQRSARALA